MRLGLPRDLFCPKSIKTVWDEEAYHSFIHDARTKKTDVGILNAWLQISCSLMKFVYKAYETSHIPGHVQCHTELP
jgi:hypothetical protein